MEPPVVENEEIALDLPQVIEVDALNPSAMPEKAQQVLCLLACGFSIASIATLSKVTPNAVRHVIEKWDPNKSFALSPQERRRFLSKLWEARAGEALLQMTPEKMAVASAGALAKIASLAGKEMERLAPKNPEQGKNPMKLLESLGAQGDTASALPDAHSGS